MLGWSYYGQAQITTLSIKKKIKDDTFQHILLLTR